MGDMGIVWTKSLKSFPPLTFLKNLIGTKRIVVGGGTEIEIHHQSSGSPPKNVLYNLQIT